jgi:hypothetical protein
LVTWSEGELSSREAIYTDGLEHEASREGCEGWEQAEFSDDGHRVYFRSSYVCEGGVERGATGLLAMSNPMEWLDIKVVEVAGQKVPWVLRYRLARASKVEEAGVVDVVAPRAMAVKAARIAASEPLDEMDIVEAVEKVESEAVGALIAERGDRIALNADRLLRLAEAGVPEDVIDVAVAVSYPDKFQINAGEAEEIPRTRDRRGYDPYYGSGWSRWSFWNPWYSPFYSPFGYRYGYGGLYGGYGGYFGGYGYYRPATIYVQPRTGDGPTHGRVINRRGYSRGGSSSVSGSSGGGASRSGAVRRSGGGSSSRGGVRSSGARSGGSSKSTGRTARRRGGGI